MDGWTARRTQARHDTGFLSGGGGGGGVKARRPEYRIRTWDQYIRTHARTHARARTHIHIHTHVQTDTWMFMHRQMNGHTCTCKDGKLKDSLLKTCIIMYRDNVRNRHVRACRGIHARVIILKYPMKMNDLVPSSPTYFIFIGYLKTGGGGGGMKGVRANPMNPNWIRHCLYMYANAQTFWLHHAWACNSYVLQNIWAELSYEFERSCLINMGRVGIGRVFRGPSRHVPSWFWAVLSVIRLFLPFTATMRYLYSRNEINLCFKLIIIHFISLKFFFHFN